jgi:amino acid permease
MAGGGLSDSTYSKKIGFIYIFNVVIGAGALALPLAFKNAGLVIYVQVFNTHRF